MRSLQMTTALGVMAALLFACGDDTSGGGGSGGGSTSTTSSSSGGGSTTTSTTTTTTTSSGGGAGGDGGMGGGGGAGGAGGMGGGGGAGGAGGAGAGGMGGGGGMPTCTPACAEAAICVEASNGPTCQALRILTLEESVASEVVGDALEAAGATVVRGPAFFDWDGTNPALTDIDAVVWFQGVDYSAAMADAAQTSLAAFVASGGGLVRTEWGAYEQGTGVADVLLPIEYGNDYDYGYEWTRLTMTPPIGASLNATFEDAFMGFSVVALKPNAVAVWEDSTALGIPLVSYTTEYGGRVVHVNHDVTYSGDIGTEMITIFRDSAIFAAGKY